MIEQFLAISSDTFARSSQVIQIAMHYAQMSMRKATCKSNVSYTEITVSVDIYRTLNAGIIIVAFIIPHLISCIMSSDIELTSHCGENVSEKFNHFSA